MGSIVEEINKKTGRSDQTIAEAVANLDIGGGGENNTFDVYIEGDLDFSLASDPVTASFAVTSCDKTFQELKSAHESGKKIDALVKMKYIVFGNEESFFVKSNIYSINEDWVNFISIGSMNALDNTFMFNLEYYLSSNGNWETKINVKQF